MRLRGRRDADERAGGRFVVAAVALVLVGLVVGVLGRLVQDRWGPLHRLDLATTRHAEQLSGLVGTAKVLTWLGAPVVVTVASLILALVLWGRGHRRVALYVLLCRGGAALLSTSLKAVVDRSRPTFAHPVSSAAGSSFPSGHALAGSSFWLALAVVVLPYASRGRRPLVLAVGVLVPLVVAATRVLLGVHYLSDVVAGLLLGFGWTVVCTALFAVWSREEGRPVEPFEAGLETGSGAGSGS